WCLAVAHPLAAPPQPGRPPLPRCGGCRATGGQPSTGALAVLAPDGTLQALCDTPTLTLKTTRGTKQEYDIPGLVALLAPYSAPQTHVIIEEAQAMPGQGVRSMFTCGLGFGVWLGMLATLGLAHTRVRPGVWKRALGLSGDKEQACLRAMQ